MDPQCGDRHLTIYDSLNLAMQVADFAVELLSGFERLKFAQFYSGKAGGGDIFSGRSGD